jgi:hypothetical protein
MSQIPHLDDILAAAAAQVEAAAAQPRPVARDGVEPPPGSVVLIHSTTGTAAQRFYDDELWHTVTGQVVEFEDLFVRAGNTDLPPVDVFLIYTAPEEPTPPRALNAKPPFPQEGRR